MEANRQKLSEWNAIKNLIPIINKKLPMIVLLEHLVKFLINHG